MNKRRDQNKFTDQARRVLEIEARAIQDLIPRLDSAFAQACELCLACAGRVVVTGMGKSGHVAGKIASTLASTGTPAFFVHPGEASHGDVGMITPKDLVIAVSNSGETAEIITILPLLKRSGVELITLTGKSDSTLAETATVNLDIGVDEEACPLNLSPTASTTAALAMGDALAVALLESRGFTREDFARSHPGGTLGRRLLLLVGDLMHTGEEVPKVSADTLLASGLIEMTAKGLGVTAIVDANGKLEGIYTDGDLRRSLDAAVDVHATTMREIMTKNPKTVRPKLLAAEAVRLLEQHQITSLIVVDDETTVVGALNVHDLFRAGVM
ncbi:MAG: KpsF/GutQ family sugar-phosphate isomerase [Gammaproteobacteria bacterium]|nr:KpsF/GutQ family sugar-phosphate isomerase [Gammaproteobacteria bacterium]